MTYPATGTRLVISAINQRKPLADELSFLASIRHFDRQPFVDGFAALLQVVEILKAQGCMERCQFSDQAHAEFIGKLKDRILLEVLLAESQSEADLARFLGYLVGFVEANRDSIGELRHEPVEPPKPEPMGVHILSLPPTTAVQTVEYGLDEEIQRTVTLTQMATA